MQAYRLIFLGGLLGAALALSACDATAPSQVQTGKMRVKEQVVTETLDADHPDQARLDAIAKNILRNGKGGVTLTVPYLKGGVAVAGREGEMFMKEFEKRGITNLSVELVNVPDRKYLDNVVLAYQSLTAVPAKGCNRIPGYQGADDLSSVESYQFGCEMQANIGKMVADPSDLLGRAGPQDSYSRRVGAVIEAYKVGTPNKPMQGFSASGGD